MEFTEPVYKKTIPKKGFEKKFGAPEVRVNVPFYDPHINGVAERGVEEVKPQIHVIKIGLGSRFKTQSASTLAVTEWLVPHEASAIHRFVVGGDGMLFGLAVGSR